MTWEPSAVFDSLGAKGVPDASGVTVPEFSVGERWGIVPAVSPLATTDPLLSFSRQFSFPAADRPLVYPSCAR